MIKFTINNYLKLQLNNVIIKDSKVKRIISNKTLISEINSRKKFFKIWRKELDYSIEREKYKIERLIKNHKGNTLIVKATVLHFFNLNIAVKGKKSIERLHYIFTFKRHGLLWKIADVKVLEEEKIFMENSIRGNFSKISKENYWSDKLSKIDLLLSQVKNNINNYKISYEEESLEDTRNRKSNYNPFEAVNYARKYAIFYNKNYRDFTDFGGDCTNFVSQCIHYGGITYNNFWKPYSHPWVRVRELYSYFINNSLGKSVSPKETLEIGSIIQFYSSEKGYFSHSGIITEALANGDYLYCCHSYDKLDFPLSEIYPLYYDKIRILKIN